jgi:hypothetical protein
MLAGETISSGASETCNDCKVKVKLQVCRSAAGWYIGTWCGCGPYSRESDYMSEEEAEHLLKILTKGNNNVEVS